MPSVAYLAALAAAVLGFNERGTSLSSSTLRRVLLLALPAIAIYAIAQRALPLPDWDQAWLDATDFNSIGASRDDEVRVFASLNSPGALAPLLALSLLCYLTVRPRHPALAVIGAALLCVALAPHPGALGLDLADHRRARARDRLAWEQREAGVRRGGGGRGGHARPVPGQRDRA